MAESNGILVGLGESQVFLDPHYGNRHGLIAGATGTGKTVTLQVLAEGFSRIGVPIFMADVKGDLSGISQPGSPNPKVEKRIAQIGLGPFEYRGNPVVFWDLFGEQGHPIRTTISDMGPLLLTRLLDLSDAQEGVLNIAFEFADDEGLLLLDLKDLKATLQYLNENAKDFTTAYGNVSASSVGAILRQLLVLEREGGGPRVRPRTPDPADPRDGLQGGQRERNPAKDPRDRADPAKRGGSLGQDLGAYGGQ